MNGYSRPVDKGIRKLINELNSAGWVTTDSGDGVSKFKDKTADETTLAIPHVFIPTMPSAMVRDADTLYSFVKSIAKPQVDFVVEASYSPGQQEAVLMLYDMNDAGLSGAADEVVAFNALLTAEE